jgi:hypothetical protein
MELSDISMRTSWPSVPEQAFSRVDLLVLLGVMALGGTVWYPALALTRQSTDHAVCVNNLRQIGRATQLWAHDHREQQPTYVPVAEGGVFGHPLSGNAWFQFAAISNQLGTPRVLVCPADPAKRAAEDFGGASQGGFVNAGYRNNALSYWLGSDAQSRFPQSFLCGDRNIRIDGSSVCGNINVANVALFIPSFSYDPWSNAIHGSWGHILHFDGRVSSFGQYIPKEVLGKADDNGLVHMLMP